MEICILDSLEFQVRHLVEFRTTFFIIRFSRVREFLALGIVSLVDHSMMVGVYLFYLYFMEIYQINLKSF